MPDALECLHYILIVPMEKESRTDCFPVHATQDPCYTAPSFGYTQNLDNGNLFKLVTTPKKKFSEAVTACADDGAHLFMAKDVHDWEQLLSYQGKSVPK